MNTFLELITTTQSDLNINDTSPLMPLATVKSALNRAYIRIGGLFRWPETEDALKTSTVSGQYYYDYPDNWRPDSVKRLEVDGDRYGVPPDGSPMSYEDYLNWKEDEPTSTLKRWANQWRRYFISPTPSSNGSNNICIWGQKVVEELVNNSDVTIFSYSMPEVNEAIVEEAKAILKAKKENDTGSEFVSKRAKEICVIAWNKIKQEQAKYEKNEPMFEVPDLFGKSSVKTNYGDFD